MYFAKHTSDDIVAMCICYGSENVFQYHLAQNIREKSMNEKRIKKMIINNKHLV